LRAGLLVALAAAVSSQDVPCADNARVPLGHFISASLSWRQLEGRTVEFEIQSTWRRDFQWPVVLSKVADPSTWKPQLGDEIPIVGLSNIPDELNDCQKQINGFTVTDGNRTTEQFLLAKQPNENGQDVFTKFDPGDGSIKTEDLKLQVVSYSEEENWLMGVTRITHTYARDYERQEPRWDQTSYVASALNKDSQQPYDAIPWKASFSGCCRQFTKKIQSTNMLTYHFEVDAMVDLANNVGSAKIITMPQVFVPKQQIGTVVRVCALPVAGMDSMIDKTGGTINYPADDNMPSEFEWSLVQKGEVLDSIMGQVLDENMGDDMLERESRRSKMCAAISVASRFSNVKDYLSIQVKLGTAVATADIELHITGETEHIERVPGVAPESKCLTTSNADDMCRYTVASGNELTEQGNIRNLFRGFRNTGGVPLYLKYVVGTVGISSACGMNACQSPLVGTSEAGRIEYSNFLMGEDHAGMPRMATFNPVDSSGGYVTEIAVDFRASDMNTRPGHEVTISASQRQYSQTVETMHMVEEMCSDDPSDFTSQPFCKVSGSNFNMGAGGADVGVWLRRVNNAKAITRVELATASDVARYQANGFEKIDHNLLEQSARGEVFLMVMRGSGPPLMNIRSTAMAGYQRIMATVASSGVTVNLYILYGADTEFTRDLNWSPCTGETSPVVVCGAAALRSTPSSWDAATDQLSAKLESSTQICTLIDPHPVRAPSISICDFSGSTPPLFDAEGMPYWEAPMGKELKICILAVRIDRVPQQDTFSIVFNETNGNPGERPPMPQLDELLTGRTPSGAMLTNLNGEEGQFTTISQDPTLCVGSDNPSVCPGMGGFMAWTPSPYQGGWNSEVCVRSCVDSGPCAGQPGVKSCVTSCFKVHVPRCRWWLQPEDSFIEIAPRFQTNWLQLWYLNPGIRHPDFDLTAHQNEITIGRLYKPQWDDTVRSRPSTQHMHPLPLANAAWCV